jgi:hypothetical protein
VTTAEPNADEQPRGRHAARTVADEDDQSGSDQAPTDAAPTENPATEDPATEEPATEDPATERPATEHPAEKSPATQQDSAGAPADKAAARPSGPSRLRRRHALAHHPAGSSLLTAAALVIGLALAPLVFDQLRFEVATRAADAARSAAAPWPAGAEPWFWPGWVATLAAVVGIVVLVVAATGVKLPDVAVLVAAVVLAAATARAVWATFDVVNARLWELVPLCILCVFAFGSAVAAAIRWRSSDGEDKGSGTGEVAGVTVGVWLLVALLLLGGSAIASSAQTHAFGGATSPTQDLAGLLSVRSANAPELADLRGSWVPQVGAAQVTDDAVASTYAVGHHGWTTRFPTVLARGDDVGAADLDDTWWLSLVAQPFGSEQEAATWCAANGFTPPDCTPRQIGD